MTLFDEEKIITYEEIDKYINSIKEELDVVLRKDKINPEYIKYLLGQIDGLEFIKKQHTLNWERKLSSLYDPLNSSGLISLQTKQN